MNQIEPHLCSSTALLDVVARLRDLRQRAPRLREPVGQHGDGPVVLGSGELPAALFTTDQPSLPIDDVSVGVAGRLPEHTDRAGGFIPSQHSIIGYIAEHEVATGREVRRALCPAAAAPQALDPLVAADAGEAWVERLELGADPVHVLSPPLLLIV